MRHQMLFRQIWIDAILWDHGSIRREDITDAFGVSVPQASKDLKDYQRIKPTAIVYNKNKKRYVRVGTSSVYDQSTREAVLKAQEAVHRVMRAFGN